MKKQEFLDALGAGLSGSSDAEEVLDFYREMIEDRMEDGMEEEAAVEQLGAVEDILARCVQGLTVPKAVCETTAGSGTRGFSRQCPGQDRLCAHRALQHCGHRI